MEVKDDSRERKTEVRQKRKNSKPEDIHRGLGTVPSSSSTFGDDQGGTSGENRNESVAFTDGRYSLDGGVVSQLIKDAEDELAFYKQQAQKIENRLKQLNDLLQEHR
jgi:hypothetical protein